MTLRATSLREILLAAKGQEVHRETVTSDEGHFKPFVLTYALVLLCVCFTRFHELLYLSCYVHKCTTFISILFETKISHPSDLFVLFNV